MNNLLLRYGVAVGAAALATLLTLLLWPLTAQIPFVLFFAAVMISAWYGGLGPGLLTTALAAACSAYFLLPPFYSLAVDTLDDALRLGLFVLVAAMISSLNDRRKRAEEAERTQREYLQVTLASIGDAVIVTDPTGAVTFLNRIAEEVTGWTTADALGKPLPDVFQIVNEKTRQPVENPVAKVLRTGAVAGLANHTVLLRKDGSDCPIDDSAAPIRDTQGRLVGIVLVFRDITDRRQVEEALRVAHQQLRFHVENSPLAVIEWDQDWRVRQWSQRAEQLFGWSAEEVHGKRPDEWRFLYEDDVPAIRDPLRQLQTAEHRLREHPRIFQENRNYTKAGKVLHCEWYSSLLFDEAGRLTSVLSLAHDVTTRKQAEETQLRMAAIVDFSDDAIISKSLTGVVTSWNAAAERLFGYRAEEMIGHSIRRLLPAERQEEEDHILAQLRQGERIDHFETVRRTKDGRAVDVAVTISPLRDARGTITGASKIARDITARKAMENALTESEQRFRTLAEALPGLVWMARPDGYLDYYNQRWADDTGLTVEQLVGVRGYEATWHPEDLPGIRASWREAVRTGQPYEYEGRLRRADSSYRWHLIRGFPLRGSDGRLLRWFGVNVDIEEQKHTAAALQESEERLRLATDSAEVGIWYYYLQEDRLLWSPQFKRLFGLAPDDTALNYERFLTHVHPEDRQRMAQLRETLAGGKDFEVEYRIVWPDGSLHWIGAKGRVFADATGQLAGFMGVGLDITARKQAEEQLRASEARQAFLLTLSDALRPLTDPSAIQETAARVLGEQLQVSRAFYVDIEHAADGDYFVVRQDYCAPGVASHVGRFRGDEFGATAFRELRAGRTLTVTNVEADARLTTAEQAGYVAMEIRAYIGVPLVKSGRFAAVLGVHQTVPRAWTAQDSALVEETAERTWAAVERARAETALRESEERLRALFAQVTAGIAETDFTGHFTLVNQRYCEILGRPMDDVLRLRLQDVTHPEDVPRNLPLFERLITEGKDFVIEKRYVRPDGTAVWVQNSVSCETHPDGRPHHAVAVVQDITDRKRAEAERERLLAELQRMNDELQQFAHIVSHDLNEPLRTMRNYVQLLALRLKGTLDDEATEFMAFVTSAAQRMQQMLADLLAYTQAGRTPEFQAVDCEAVLTQVLTALQTRITECEAVITHDPLPTIQGDATRISQVLQNLISNALKFCEIKPPRIHITAVKEDHHWRFSMRDNGIGIDPQQVGKLFQVFQRAHGKEYAGTGIGLAICKRIIEQHGGRVWVESQPRTGSTFHFTISEKSRQHGERGTSSQ